MPKSKNTGNTAMVFHQGKLFGLMEGGTPYQLSLPDLTTLGEHDFEGTLSHNFTAHPQGRRENRRNDDVRIFAIPAVPDLLGG